MKESTFKDYIFTFNNRTLEQRNDILEQINNYLTVNVLITLTETKI